MSTFGEAEKFFFEHAGWSHDPNAETSEEGRNRMAIHLAAAERWRWEVGCLVEWVLDPDADRSFLPKRDKRPLFGCILRHEGGRITSLWGIDLGKTGTECEPYRRVVEAGLASELMV